MDALIDAVFERHFRCLVEGAVRPEQRQVIRSVLEGRNTLALMPTGAGKSLCYWIAGKALGGTTLVISPLMALMDEQAGKLAQCGCSVTTLHSDMDPRKQYDELISLYNGQAPDFIFLSPERLATDGFLEFVLKSRSRSIKLVVVDEAHCISQWGFDFRPFYKEIPPFLSHVFGESARPPVLGLSATMNPADVSQMRSDFGIGPEEVKRSNVLLRHEIDLRVSKVGKEIEKEELLWQTLEAHRDDKMLVYVEKKKGERGVEELSKEAVGRGFRADHFHADLSSPAKLDVVQRFRSGETSLVFATSAFGMGIDIPDIRGILHYSLPGSIEQFYQQTGRGGRDGKPSWSLLIYSDKNVDYRRSFFIEKAFPTSEQVEEAFSRLSDKRIGKRTFDYFVDETLGTAFHYLVRAGVIRVVCKGLVNLGVFSPTKSGSAPEFEALKSATRTGLLIATAKKTGRAEDDILETVYRRLAEGRLRADRTPAKCLIVESFSEELPEGVLAQIERDIEEKKEYKNGLLDEFVRLLEGYTDSQHLHQDIGAYLGVGSFQLGRLYQTLSGDMVRSKSEVIIANILYERQIPFQYEAPLVVDGQCYSPDFTISWAGKTYYWEHLGLLEQEQYQGDWRAKETMYKAHFPDALITTVESSTLSRTAERIVADHFR